MDWLRGLFGKPSPPVNARQLVDPPALRSIDPLVAPSQGFAKPHFRFFPACYDFGQGDFGGGQGEAIFRRDTGPCHVCAMRDIWRYQRRVYWTRRDEPVICAQCIADGRLGELLAPGGFYGLHDTEVEALDWRDPPAEEVVRRTPGFATFNPFTWPVCGGVPMAFMGYGDAEGWKDVPEALAAMRAANEGEDCFPAPYALIFKQVDGPAYRAVFDWD